MEIQETRENGRAREDDDDDDDDDEALSLCDLPLIHRPREEREGHTTPLRASIETDQYDQDFDFCSLSKDSEMCAADEVFYQGQILPLRPSLVSRKEFLRSISRSESMDRHFSSGLVSSRSSSVSSHHSSTSGSSSATPADVKAPQRNQFHSHPSPSPKLHSSGNRISNRNCTQKSSAWNVFRLGLVAAPREIEFRDLKTRCPSKNVSSEKRRIKPWDFLGACSCSAAAVDAVSSKAVNIKRSASDGVCQIGAIQAEEETLVGPKKRFYHRRTFEWLKQLSIEDTADET